MRIVDRRALSWGRAIRAAAWVVPTGLLVRAGGELVRAGGPGWSAPAGNGR